jgi:hypothetical protein
MMGRGAAASGRCSRSSPTRDERAEPGGESGRPIIRASRLMRLMVWGAGLLFCVTFWGAAGWLAWTRPVMAAEVGLAVSLALLIVAALWAWDAL